MHDELLLSCHEPSTLERQWEALVDECRGRPAVSLAGRMWFLAAWLFVGLVSVWDGYLVWLYDCCIYFTELNPICKYLIKLNRYDVTLLLLCKATSTLLVLLVLQVLFSRAPRLAFPVVNCVALFQLLLLLFLHSA